MVVFGQVLFQFFYVIIKIIESIFGDQLNIILFILLPMLSFSEDHFCFSSKNKKIEHYDFLARQDGTGKKILVFSGVHGDELPSLELAWAWIKRLEKIKTPSNSWRIIPLLNPDGFELKTRTNANGVDINRNFPTKDWNDQAISHWKNILKSAPRRYPGASSASEVETKCALYHIENYKPDLVISIHTPYGLFDFDGPKDKKIQTHLLPWKRLGTFTGSLGRYLWDERGVPVLTIELKNNSLPKNFNQFVTLQDQLSTLAN